MSKQYKPQQPIPFILRLPGIFKTKYVGGRTGGIIPAFPFSQKAEGEWFPEDCLAFGWK